MASRMDIRCFDTLASSPAAGMTDNAAKRHMVLLIGLTPRFVAPGPRIPALPLDLPRQLDQRGGGAAAVEAQPRRAAVRDLAVMVDIGAGDRDAEAAAAVEMPRGRQQRETQQRRLARDQRRRIGASKAAMRPGRAMVG